MNNVGVRRRELQKDHHDPKQETKLLPEGEGQGQGLRKRVAKAPDSGIGNIRETQQEQGQNCLK